MNASTKGLVVFSAVVGLISCFYAGPAHAGNKTLCDRFMVAELSFTDKAKAYFGKKAAEKVIHDKTKDIKKKVDDASKKKPGDQKK